MAGISGNKGVYTPTPIDSNKKTKPPAVKGTPRPELAKPWDGIFDRDGNKIDLKTGEKSAPLLSSILNKLF